MFILTLPLLKVHGGILGNRTLHSFLAKETRRPWNMRPHLGAGTQNRTEVFTLEGCDTSRCTIPANLGPSDRIELSSLDYKTSILTVILTRPMVRNLGFEPRPIVS